jgi:hypothetical protein
VTTESTAAEIRLLITAIFDTLDENFIAIHNTYCTKRGCVGKDFGLHSCRFRRRHIETIEGATADIDELLNILTEEEEWMLAAYESDDQDEHGPADSDDKPDRDEYEPGGLHFD